MYNIAIIDDDEKYALGIKMHMRNFNIEYSYEVHIFHSALAFLESKYKYDLLLLDIEMPGMSGIELAQRLLEEDQLIIYLSSYQEHIYDAFGVNIFKFILKDRIHQDLEHVIYTAFQFLQRNSDLVIKTEWGPALLRQKDICVIIFSFRKVSIHTKTEIYKIACLSLADFKKELNDNFIYINRSTIINKNFMKYIRDGKLYMYEYDGVLEISRRKIPEVNNALYERLKTI